MFNALNDPWSLNAPFGASVLSDKLRRRILVDMPVASLNAPFGARCFLTGKCDKHNVNGQEGLNAPFGARCFLTLSRWRGITARAGS